MGFESAVGVEKRKDREKMRRRRRTNKKRWTKNKYLGHTAGEVARPTVKSRLGVTLPVTFKAK